MISPRIPLVSLALLAGAIASTVPASAQMISGPQVENTRSAVEPNSFSTRTACFDTASIERSNGVFLSSASPVQLTNAVGMTSVTLLPLVSSHGGLVGSQAV